MQQIIYDIIDNCFTYNNKINNPENNSANSDITNTPPQSTNSGSCNSHILSQKENKKIVFNVFRNYKINIINNNENNNINNLNINNNYNNKNKFINKKRKRIFGIQKIQKKNNSTKKIYKKINIFKQQFQLPTIQEDKKFNNLVIDILIDKNNNNIKKLKNNNNINNNSNNINSNIKTDNTKNLNKIDDNISSKDKNINNKVNKTNNDNKNKEENNKENKIDKNNKVNIDKKIDNDNKSNKDKDETNKKKKKKTSAQNEKELQLMYEQKFLENINKEYPDKEYEKDMNNILNDKKMKFMKDNFPMMFKKDKFYLYSILPKKRLSSKEYFISPNYFNTKTKNNLFNNNPILYPDYDLNFKNINSINSSMYISLPNPNSIDISKYFNIKKNKNNINNKNKIFNIIKIKKIKKINNNKICKNKIYNNTDLIIKEKYSFIPKKIWSLNNQKINVEKFFDDCVQIWPFDECCFVKEIALEFLMKNNYDMDLCLRKNKEFVYFMKKRAEELDFPIISESIKTIKKYNLRKTNYN